MDVHRPNGSKRATLAVLMVVVVVVVACSSSSGTDTPACVNVSLDCKPIVSPPTFDALYANVFQPTCASNAGRCHGAAASNGLDMQTPDSAYAGLRGRIDTATIGCSLLLERLESPSASFRMPPGADPLSEPQRCAIRQWIANGATR